MLIIMNTRTKGLSLTGMTTPKVEAAMGCRFCGCARAGLAIKRCLIGEWPRV